MDTWIVALICLVLAITVGIARQIGAWQWRHNLPVSMYELIPHHNADISLLKMNQQFVLIQRLLNRRSLMEKLMGRKYYLKLCVRSTHYNGIQYFLSVPTIRNIEVVKTFRTLSTQLIIQLHNNESELTATFTRRLSVRQTGHYAIPLTETTDQVDPLSNVFEQMASPDHGESLSYEINLTPIERRSARRLARKIMRQENVLPTLRNNRSGFGLFLRLVHMSMFIILDAISLDSYQYRKLQPKSYDKPDRSVSSFELDQLRTVEAKVKQPLFHVRIGLSISADSRRQLQERTHAFRSAFSGYTSVLGQRLQVYREHFFVYRVFCRRSILSVSETAGLFHFPLDTIEQSENQARTLSRKLPTTVAMKRSQDFDVRLGMNEYHGRNQPIGLTSAERERHVYMIGGTGNGKTTLLQYAIVQDIRAGKGVAVLDPHGDMAETLLHHIPDYRAEDIIYFNPDDIQYPIGLNLLEIPKGLSDDDLMREKDLITEAVISVFRKIFSDDDSGGHRIEYVLRNTIQTALTIPDATLFTLFDLLNDPKYRRRIVKQLDNKDLINFWKHELGQAGDMQRVKMAAGITAKIGRFLFSASAKRILEQPKSTINFDEILKEGKILICNLSKGLLGEDTSELFGILILAELQLASLRRARIKQTERTPYFVYVDEFQNFATTSFVQMLSESRKYKVYITMAEQSTSQQSDREMVNTILANVGTVLTFRTANPKDEQLLLPLFQPYVIEGEIAHLPSYNFIIKANAITPQEPMTGMTVLLEETPNTVDITKITENSRTRYAAKVTSTRQTKGKPATLDEPKISTLPEAIV